MKGMAIRDERPWGRFEVLDQGAGYQVKRIEVLPGKRLSYQKHAHRSEHWVIVQGDGVVTLAGSDHTLHAGDTIDVGVGVPHRIANPGTTRLTFIEVQRGDYLGEDDIVRLEDDYGRVPTA